jgi:hypothetical protein
MHLRCNFRAPGPQREVQFPPGGGPLSRRRAPPARYADEDRKLARYAEAERAGQHVRRAPLRCRSPDTSGIDSPLEAAKTAQALTAAHEPGEALARWLQRCTEFVATKRGFAAALHSGDPTFDARPGYFTTTTSFTSST